MSPLLISIAAFVGVAALVVGVSMLLRGDKDAKIEDRLNVLTGTGPVAAKQAGAGAVLRKSLEDSPMLLELLLARFGKSKKLFEQADTSLTPSKFMLISGGCAALGAVAAVYTGMGIAVAPMAALTMSALPLMWLLFRRKRRFKAFGSQLSDSLELIARALRSGHSLAAGFDLVQKEMPAPIGVEFGRVFEEQNLGRPLEEALEDLTERIPNTDLRFFATAIILQRQTGGDLAEILDKIGTLIRERYKVWGQVQALTGEGRLSGVVLLALPPLLFLAVYRLNPDYVMLLFRDPMGKQMLMGAVIMQLLGAICIRKIVNIKV